MHARVNRRSKHNSPWVSRSHSHTHSLTHIHSSHASILSSYLKRFFFWFGRERRTQRWELRRTVNVANMYDCGYNQLTTTAARVWYFFRRWLCSAGDVIHDFFLRSIKSRIASKEKRKKLINNAKRVSKWRWRSFHVGDDTLYAIYWCWRAHHISTYCPVDWNRNFITTLHDVVVWNVIRKTMHRIHLQTELVFTCTTHTFGCRCVCVLSRCHRRARAHCAIESERNTP